MPLVDDERESLWMLPGYFEGIEVAGGVPIMFPLTNDKKAINQLVEMCGGLLFTGGHDVSPELYGEKPLNGSVISSPRRDEMEKIALEAALGQNKAVLGICRGIQFINAALGGTLYQDLPSQHHSKTEHHQKPPYDVPIHKVKIVDGSPLYDLLGKETLDVNSYHHQAVKVLAPSLKAMALSEDGLVEAVYKTDARFVWAVQWHPEFSFRKDEASRAIFKKFVEEAGK